MNVLYLLELSTAFSRPGLRDPRGMVPTSPVSLAVRAWLTDNC